VGGGGQGGGRVAQVEAPGRDGIRNLRSIEISKISEISDYGYWGGRSGVCRAYGA
jgi:hypothetical protein